MTRVSELKASIDRDSALTVRALRGYAAELRVYARSRKMGGPGNKGTRYQLRAEAARALALAGEIESGDRWISLSLRQLMKMKTSAPEDAAERKAE